MKVYLDCYPCFLRQALDAARLARADVLQHVHVLYAVKGGPILNDATRDDALVAGVD